MEAKTARVIGFVESLSFQQDEWSKEEDVSNIGVQAPGSWWIRSTQRRRGRFWSMRFTRFTITTQMDLALKSFIVSFSFSNHVAISEVQDRGLSLYNTGKAALLTIMFRLFTSWKLGFGELSSLVIL
ncbi:hypothetical protein Patl1_22094 [Pistacia atlantica]|uniref:Uncharacterized protein n=2 Tax=Pistacia TaxID=55512 RepID=A0ACC1BNM6_9ROSI|nr:hypothetical protein Patl1_22094 [Pistacia atlantica]